MSTTTRSPVFIPDYLLTEFLSLLPVKSLLRFKCVSNSWNTLISDPYFVKFHVKKSTSRSPYFTLVTSHNNTNIRRRSPDDNDDKLENDGELENDYTDDSEEDELENDDKLENDYTDDSEDELENGYTDDSEDELKNDYSIIPYPISSFLDNPSFTISADDCYLLSKKDKCNDLAAGFCNGLICLTGYRPLCGSMCEYWFKLWNPATRAISKKLGIFRDFYDFNFNFGCDNTGTYKVIASRFIRDQLSDPLTNEVRVFSDNVWRHIESFPLVPFHCPSMCFNNEHNAVSFNGTLNWLASYHDNPDDWYMWYHELKHLYDTPKEITVKQFVILSLDLGTETYHQYILPRGFDKVPPAEPTISVLGDCLCFSYSYREIDLIIWQMKKFGDEESWTQFLKISYHHLQLDYDFSSNERLKYDLRIRPWFLSKDGNTLILSIIIDDTIERRGEKSFREPETILYNWRDQRVERAKVSVHKTIIDDNNTANNLRWRYANSFFESLIPPFVEGLQVFWVSYSSS